MRIFVTGATGFVGSAVVQTLLNAGHAVLGLARSDASASALEALGVEVHRGNLEDLSSMQSGAAKADAVIHTGFNHDFSNFKANCEMDRQVILALGEVLRGSDRRLIVTSGIGLLAPGQLGKESDMPNSASPRVASEQACVELAESGVNVCVVRLPPSVHGEGDHGFVPILINFARQKGVAAYIGDGLYQWPSVHRYDAAHLYRLVLEKGIAGERYHAVAEQGVAFKDIASVIGKRLNVPVESIPVEKAATHFEWFAHFAQMNNPATSEHTRHVTGWETTECGLLEDIDQDFYFRQ